MADTNWMQPFQNGGFAAQNPYLQQSNPQLQSTIDNTLGDMSRNYNNTTKSNMESSMASSGSFGNSGLAQIQGEQQRNLMQEQGRAASGIRFNDYQQQAQMYGQDRNRDLQAQQQANGYDLGLRSNDLGFSQLDSNIYQQNFNNQMAGAEFGLNAYNTLQNGNNLGLTAGNAMQQTPIGQFGNFSQNSNSIGNGYSTGTSSQTNQGNPYVSAIGGAMMANNMYNQYTNPQGK